MNLPLRDACLPLLERCDELFVLWFEQLHGEGSVQCLSRMQSFVTRYRARPNENALLRHIDGALVSPLASAGMHMSGCLLRLTALSFWRCPQKFLTKVGV